MTSLIRFLQFVCVLCTLLPKVDNQTGVRFRDLDLSRNSDSDKHTCDRKEEKFGARIVGGNNINIQDVPYQVSLQYHFKHYCGGAVITSIHVVTAAHCTDDKLPQDLNIRAGSTHRDFGGLAVRVRCIFNHPYFNNTEIDVDYDIAVLKLANILPFNHHIQPVTVASRYARWPPGTTVLVSGWGITEQNQPSDLAPENLQGVLLVVVNRRLCEHTYKNTFSENMLCLGSTMGAKDTCQGDSGGPVVSNGILVGLVSFGYGCGQPGVPGVYTNVAAFRNFLEYATRL